MLLEASIMDASSTDAFDIVMVAIDDTGFNDAQRRAIINKLDQKTNTVGARGGKRQDMDSDPAGG